MISQEEKRRITTSLSAGKLADDVIDMVNVLGNREPIDYFVTKLVRTDFTLQQCVFSKIILNFIEQIANTPEDWFDGRNEATKKYCDIIFEALQKRNLAYQVGEEKTICECPFI